MEICGWSVLAAHGPAEAVSIVADATSEPPDVAILDYNMPVMNGCALAARLRSLCPELKIILYSGAFEIPPGELARVDAFISKGDGIDRLVEQTEEFAPVGAGPPAMMARNMAPCSGMNSGRF
jgi:CheY-like chemotaxis protein